MTHLHRSSCAAAVIASTMLTGCFNVGPDYSPPPDDLAAGWSDARMPQSGAEPQPQWWRLFGDPVLQQLIDEGLAQNLSLESSALRVIEAKVNRRLAFQYLLPIAPGGGSVSHVNLSENIDSQVEIDSSGASVSKNGKPIPLDVTLPDVRVSDELDIYEMGLDATWELDIWGRRRKAVTAADAEVEAAYANYADGYVSLAAEIATTYVQLRTFERRRALLLQNADLTQKNLELAQNRKAAGTASDLDVLQLLALLRETEAGIPPLDAATRHARNALCTLLGRPPGALDERLTAAAVIPTAPVEIAVGIPADLLRRRPDVRRAEREAAAQCERIGIAKAELYPNFSLFGSLGLEASHSNDLFDSDSATGSYGLGFKWNILLYAIIMDAVRVQDARYQQALLGYRETVLRAAREVEDGSTALLADQQQLAKLVEATAAQERTVALGSDLYKQGVVDLSRLLDSQRSLTRIQDDATVVQGSVALHAIALYKALGGGWESVNSDRIVPEATWKAMSDRTDWDWYRPSTVQDPSPAPTNEP